MQGLASNIIQVLLQRLVPYKAQPGPCCSFRSLSVLSETWRRRFARSLAGALHPLTGTGTRALEPASRLGFLAATRATQGLQGLQGLHIRFRSRVVKDDI